MDRATVAFWLLIAALLSASGFFGVKAEQQRRELQQASGAVASGDFVRFVSALDGDTVLMATTAGENVTVRLVGIKTFDADPRDPVGAYGQQAVDGITRTLADRPVRVLLNDPPKDKKGRTLATLFVGESDVALSMVRDGTALVYTEFPFPAMALYLGEQRLAREERRGLWANEAAVNRADGLAKEWGAQDE